MAKVNALQYSFAVGEFSRAAMARIDQERVKLAAEIQENLFPYTIGKGLIRPGTGYLGNTASNNRARFIPFIKAVDDVALLELTNNLLRVWVNDALITRAAVSSGIGNVFITPSVTITVTIATPAVVTWTGHGLPVDTPVSFKTTGALPTGITAGVIYYLISAGLGADTFQFATSVGGAAVNTSGAQSGVHTGDAYWVTTVTGGATSSIISGQLQMACASRGGTALAKQPISTASSGIEHALRITVLRGPIVFKCGSSADTDDYIGETSLDTGIHSLAFTPTGSQYWVQFFSRAGSTKIVSAFAVESAGVMTIAAPWAASELGEITHDQSADIIFLAHENWQQRKIERRSTTSWSLVLYVPDDGPFLTAKSADVVLTPDAVVNTANLFSDRPFFTGAHIGALFKLSFERFSAGFNLAAGGEWSDPVRVSGVGVGRALGYVASGTWVGTITLQRSLDGPDSGFVTHLTTTINVSTALTDGLDNVDAWYRIGFDVGGYTSGVAFVSMSFSGGGGSGVCRVVGYTSSTQVSVDVLDPFPLASFPTSNWLEGAWSDVQGWLSAVALFDGRLWWAAQDRFWASESDDYYAFNLDTVGDAGSIQRSIATGGAINTVHWMLPLQRLVFGSDGSEATARASNLETPLTPTNLTVKDASTQGSAPVAPAKMDGRGVFVQRSSRQVYEILYTLDKQDYGSTCLTKFNEVIGGDGFTQIAVQRQPQSYIWFVRADGQCPILLYDPSEQVMGWIRFIGAPSLAGDAVVESICVLPGAEQDTVYLSVKRTINGSVVRFVERLMKHSDAMRSATIRKMADAATLTVGPVSSVTLAHLANETGLVGWGTTGGSQVVLTGLSANASGVIALGATYTNVWVGLKYNWRYKSSKLAYAAQGGTALLQRKRVGPVGLLAADIMYGAIQFGPDFDTMDPLPLIKDGTDVSQTEVYEEWDEPSFPFRGGWETDSRLCMKGSAPYIGSLLGIVAGIETHET